MRNREREKLDHLELHLTTKSRKRYDSDLTSSNLLRGNLACGDQRRERLIGIPRNRALSAILDLASLPHQLAIVVQTEPASKNASED